MPSLRESITVGWATMPTEEGISRFRDGIIRECCDADRYTREQRRCIHCCKVVDEHSIVCGECAR